MGRRSPGVISLLGQVAQTTTHVQRLADSDTLLNEFADDSAALGAKLAVVLVQLPSSLTHDHSVAPGFHLLAARVDAQIVCEPPYPT